ncbi:MAG: hypothetical protein SRB2_01803 [Desulfobacteraceae bacterium Eth-SRB2]|nr:MAG: hypothetical protein SRB2_01803 [Desulfobacteraceae bacterium Eth-SRB2]
MSTYHFFINIIADHVAMAAVTDYNAGFEIPKFCIAKDKCYSLFLVWLDHYHIQIIKERIRLCAMQVVLSLVLKI